MQPQQILTAVRNGKIILVVIRVHAQSPTCKDRPQVTEIVSIITVYISLDPGIASVNDYRRDSVNPSYVQEILTRTSGIARLDSQCIDEVMQKDHVL